MRLRKQDNPPPFLNARDQRRLLMLVGLLAIVLIATKLAGRPSTWYWLTGPPTVENGSDAAVTQHEEVDARLKSPEDDLPPGGFRVVDPPADKSLTPPSEPASSRTATDLNPQLLADVRDNTLGIRNAERESYYRILAHARNLTPDQLQSATNNNVTFAQMFTDPDGYRGRLVTVKGSVKRLYPIKVLQNESGIESVYEAWILTPDSGKNPLLLHCTSIPADIPTGDGLDLPCRFTGYFFKKYAYAAGHGAHSTTLLLGRQLDWTPPPASAAGRGFAPYFFGIVCLLGVVVVVAVWRYSAGDRRFRRQHLDRILQAAHEPPTDNPDDK